MRLLVCGGRDFRDRPFLYRALDQLDLEHCIDCIIEGEASGADRLARDWARSREICWDPYPADWSDLSHPDAVIKRMKNGREYDAMAGHRRNKRMLQEGRPDMVAAFKGGSGTLNMMKQALEQGVPVRKLWGPCHV